MAAAADASGGAPVPSFDVCFHSTWGPPTEVQFEQFDKLPFKQFTRSTKIGKAADFGGFLRAPMRGRFARSGEDRHAELDFRAGDDEDDDGSFIRVETEKRPSKPMGAPRGANQRRQQQPQGGPQRGAAGAAGRMYDDPTGGGRAGRQQTGSSFNKRYTRLNKARYASMSNAKGGGGRIIREWSVKIQPDWNELETVDMSTLRDLSTPAPGAADVKDHKWTGALDAYDEDFDRITAKSARKLKKFEDRYFFFTSTQEDPILTAAWQEGLANVIATDIVLAHLMTCTKSVYPWDIVATVMGGDIILDVRDPLAFDLSTVGETAPNPPSETDPSDPNGRKELAIEASSIQQNFSQQVLAVNNGRAAESAGAKEVAPEPNPLWDAEAAAADGATMPASGAFRYRSFKLPKDPSISLLARTTVHSVLRRKAGGAAGGAPAPQYLQIYALNEYDSKLSGSPDFRQMLDLQRANVLASEIRSNAHRVARYTASALLAGADSMRIGFVSRAARTDVGNHVILGAQTLIPSTFASQQQLKPENMWGILQWLVTTVRRYAASLREAEGTSEEEFACKFVLARDPTAAKLKLFAVPLDAFEAEEGADAGEEEEGADAEGGPTGWEGADE